MDGIQERYFSWLLEVIKCDHNPSRIRSLKHLFVTDFTYTIPMDANRESDGINLRYEFGRQAGIPEPVIASGIDIRPCSVLEMMVALAVRMEVEIMGNPDVGIAPDKWFWSMYNNMQLDKMLNRTYNADGTDGGMFVLRQPRADLRVIEIWYQAMWYLTENYI